MGVGNRAHILYMIDFGLAKKYREQSTKKHIEYRGDKNLTGTARYASVNAHLGRLDFFTLLNLGVEQSRRDDLESMGYVLMYFLRGNLPWQGLAANTKKQKYEKIKEKKIGTAINNLCQDCPSEFAMFLNYVRGLNFTQSPDYIYIRQLFKSLFKEKKYEVISLYPSEF